MNLKDNICVFYNKSKAKIKDKLYSHPVLYYIVAHPKVSSFFLLYILFVFVYFLFKENIHFLISNLEIFGVFISGILYTFGTTGGLAIFVIHEQSKVFDPLFISLIAGVGAGLIDILTFKYIEKSFADELHKISKFKPFVWLSGIKFISNKYFYAILGIILMASPVSDDFGIYFLNKVKDLKNIHIFVIGFIVNFIGIYMIAIF